MWETLKSASSTASDSPRASDHLHIPDAPLRIVVQTTPPAACSSWADSEPDRQVYCDDWSGPSAGVDSYGWNSESMYDDIAPPTEDRNPAHYVVNDYPHPGQAQYGSTHDARLPYEQSASWPDGRSYAEAASYRHYVPEPPVEAPSVFARLGGVLPRRRM